MTIYLSEEVGPDDRVDAHAAIQHVINMAASEGRRGPLVFDAFWNGSRTYLLKERVNGGFTFPAGFRGEIVFDDRAVLDWSEYGDVTTTGSGGATGAKSIFNAKGSLGVGCALAQDGNTGDPSIRLATGTGVNFGRNTDALIASADLFTTMDSATTAQKGERVIVDRMEGDVAHLKGDLHDLYRVAANAKLYPVHSVSLKVRNPQMRGPGRSSGNFRGDKAISIIYGRDCLVEGGRIERADMAAVSFGAVLNGSILNVTVMQDAHGDNAEVGFCFLICDGCDSILVAGNSTYGGQQPYDLSGSGELGIARRIRFQSNRAKGAYSSAYALHDSQELVIFDDNEADACENGIDCRGGNVLITECRFANLGTGLGNTGCGVQLREKAVNIHIENLRVSGAIRGVWLKSDPSAAGEAPPSNIQIIRNQFLGMLQRGLELRFAHTTGFIPDVAVQGNKIICVDAARGIELGGRFLCPIITDNVMTGGVGGRSIYLNAGDGKTASMGPESPQVRRNSYTRHMAEPLIHHATGVADVGDNPVLAD